MKAAECAHLQLQDMLEESASGAEKDLESLSSAALESNSSWRSRRDKDESDIHVHAERSV